MDPVTRLEDLDVNLSKRADALYVLDIVDKRTGEEIISLPASQASWLAIGMMARLSEIPNGQSTWPPFARRRT